MTATSIATALKRVARRIAAHLTRAVLLALFITLSTAGAAYAWLNKNILSTLPGDLSEFRTYRPPTACRVFAYDGQEIDQFYLERRIWVPLAELPPVVVQAFLAAEDRRFFDHPGVDAFGIARAAVENLQAGTIIEGGSTLTQQLVKNLLVGTDRTFKRKLAEAILAYRLERELTKKGVLELYLNYVYLGSGNYGVEAAAQDYFGITARSLNAAQAAMLAALVPAPSRISPRQNPTLAKERRDHVLRAMLREGYLGPDEVEHAREQPLAHDREARPDRDLAAAYVTHVRREIRRIAGPQVPFEQGLRVHTALDRRLQRVAHEAVREALTALGERQGKRGPIRRLPQEEWDAFLLAAAGFDRTDRGDPEPPHPGQCFPSLVGPTRDLGDLRAGPWRFRLREADRSSRVRDVERGRTTEVLAKGVAAGDVLRVCVVEKEEVVLDPRPWGEGAAVIVDNATGEVVALVGGYEVGVEGFVRATQARRQPGSSFKPFVYSAALLEGGTQLDPVVDGPLVLPAGGGRVWAPKNYTGNFLGKVPLRTALAQSLNTAAVRLAMRVGPSEIVRVAHSMGVRSPLRPDLTIALGSAEVTPLEQAMAYATIARMGVPTDPVFIRRVWNVDGDDLGSAGGPLTVKGEAVGQLPGGSRPRALPAAVAYQVADMLREVVRAGTARKAWAPDKDRAGKTGTTNDYTDAWFVGFTPGHTIAVWIGTDGSFPLGEKETGGRAALPAWIKIVEAVEQREAAGIRLPVPDDVVLVPHSGTWIGLPRDAMPPDTFPTGAVDPAPLPAFGAG